MPDANVVFSGDLVEYHSACYCGDAHLKDWPETLKRLGDFKANALVPGRGAALATPDKVRDGIDGTRDFLSALYDSAKASVAKGLSLKDTFAATKQVDGSEILELARSTSIACRSMSRAPMTRPRASIIR